MEYIHGLQISSRYSASMRTMSLKETDDLILLILSITEHYTDAKIATDAVVADHALWQPVLP